MLRRARVLVPALAFVAVVLGARVSGGWVIVVAIGMAALGVVLERRLATVEQARLQQATDQVVAVASGEAERVTLEVEGSRQWHRLAGALDEIAVVLRRRFDQLRTERARIERLLDVMPTAVLLFGEDGLVYANPAAVKLFDMVDPLGLSPVRALGVPALHEAVEETTATGNDVTINASRADRELMGRVARTGADETVLIVTDLTDVRRVEAIRRDFVANASHELKTPVTGIWALADSLELALQRDPERARTMVTRIQLEAARLSQLVRDLLDLARLEEGADGRSLERIDLTELCQRQIERLRLVADNQEIEVELQSDGEAGIVGIRDDLNVIVGNLIHNAIQYNHAGGAVTVTVGRQGSEATISVSDDGIGIPEADQDRIFERFYRVDKARSRAAGGTGLGLALIRHAVERHGGEVTVTSVLGEGSQFVVTLPVDGTAA